MHYFHAYEYLALLIIAAIYSSNPVIVGAALGYALHLILDTIGNDCTFAGYCISYRIMRMDKEKREKSIFMDGDGRAIKCWVFKWIRVSTRKNIFNIYNS